MIYLDNNATTKIDRRVYMKQCEVLNRFYGNPSSLHPIGVSVDNLIQHARKNVAQFMNADFKAGDRIIFTSCATESNNTVLHSFINPHPEHKHVIVSAVEHPSILNTVAYYERIGCHVTYIGVDKNGIIDERELLEAIQDNTQLISIMLANSETGVINDIARLVSIAKRRKPDVIFHTDAVQAAGKIPLDVSELGVDLLTLSGHKFHAPKGIGVLFIKNGVEISPFLIGGHQEGGLRAGTENSASIVALGEAALLANERLLSGRIKQVELLRNEMEKSIIAQFPSAIVFGKKSLRIGNTSNIGFKNIDGLSLMLQLAKRKICVSSGTACNSKSAKPSAVLIAMNVPKEYIRSIRISLSCENTKDEIQELQNALNDILKK